MPAAAPSTPDRSPLPGTRAGGRALPAGSCRRRTPRLRLQLERVLELERSHGREAVTSALGRAVEFARYGHEDVAAILLAGGAAPPSSLAPSVPLTLTGLPEVPTRQMQSYRWSQ